MGRGADRSAQNGEKRRGSGNARACAWVRPAVIFGGGRAVVRLRPKEGRLLLTGLSLARLSVAGLGSQCCKPSPTPLAAAEPLWIYSGAMGAQGQTLPLK